MRAIATYIVYSLQGTLPHLKTCMSLIWNATRLITHVASHEVGSGGLNGSCWGDVRAHLGSSFWGAPRGALCQKRPFLSNGIE